MNNKVRCDCPFQSTMWTAHIVQVGILTVATMLSRGQECAAASSGGIDPFILQTAQRAAFPPAAFKFSYPAGTPMPGGTLSGFFDIESNPWLATLDSRGLFSVVLELEPCGVVFAHSHRATEHNYVVHGNLSVAWTEELGGRFIQNTAGKGEVLTIPESLPHVVSNPWCDKTKFVAFLDAADPGVIEVKTILQKVPTGQLQALLGVDSQTASAIQSALEADGGPPLLNVDPDCEAKCDRGSSGQATWSTSCQRLLAHEVVAKQGLCQDVSHAEYYLPVYFARSKPCT
eukprot:TRINITY_DN49264_c0_g1_i1.p1 TRINITY_DN49264_c0_g1~~TRINITY_DN49264_c0_g1_i1.p1  ORF type:complete len:287 (+),score=35.56 TRINITY_DN49264_c0_g1_i1:232-1092(+)